MRNLKRALSLLLSSTMVLGMLVMGSSAKTFTDAEDISNAEAVTIVDGLDVMNGYPDGSFKPEGIVTRAEMAVVISKMLYGPEFNPANFEGAGTFTDTPDWAEGYINLCASLNIIAGRGNGIFDPDATVTTSEAAAMFLRTLGYLQTSEEFGTDWQLAVTSKATNLGLYGDLKLSINEGLSRENVAEMAFNTLFAQRVAYDDYRGLYVKANDRNVVVTNGTEDEMNTLAQNTFGLYSVEGIVTANSYTNIDLIKDTNVAAQTMVAFDEDTDVNRDGKKDGLDYAFEYETGLDMIGHATEVYYTIENKSPVVYAMVDKAVKAEVAFTGSNFSTVAREAGFNRNTSDTVIALNYVLSDNPTYSTYDNGEPVLLISNNNNLNVDYAIILDQDLDYVEKVAVNNGDPEYPITTYTLDVLNGMTDDTNCVVLGEVEKDDYVIVTPVNNDGVAGADLYIIEAAATENEILTVVDRTYQTTDKLSSATETYKKSKVVVPNGLAPTSVPSGTSTQDYAVTAYAHVALVGEYTLIFDAFDKLIGVAPLEVDNSVDVAYVAQYGYKINTDPSLNDEYRLTALVYFADGSHGTYYIDNTDGYFDDVKVDKDGKLTKNGSDWPSTSATVATLNTDDDSNKLAVGTYIRLWDVDLQDNNTVVIDSLSKELGDLSKITQHKTGVTYMGAGAKNFYGSSETVFFYVDGQYDGTKSDNGLSVGIVTGVANIPTLTLNKTTADATKDVADMSQAIYKDVLDSAGAVKYYGVTAMLLTGEELVTSQSGIYFYNEKYTITRQSADEYTLTYHLCDAATGESTSFTYDKLFTEYKDAKDEAEKHGTGYYKIQSKNLRSVYAETDTAATPDSYTGEKYSSTKNNADFGDKYYVVSTLFKDYETYGDILTLYTAANNNGAGVVATDAKVVDLTDNGVETLADLASLIATNQATHDNAGSGVTVQATVSYTYDVNDNNADIIYVTSVTDPYSKDYGTGTPSSKYAFDIANMTVTNAAGLLNIQTDKILVDGVAEDDSTASLSDGDLTVSVALVNGGGYVDLGTRTIAGVDFNNGQLRDAGNAADNVKVPGITVNTGNTYRVNITFDNGSYSFTTEYVVTL